MIRFTIITVTFNAEAVFQRTANSVLMQTYPYVEHLIIDGASRDRTVEMAHIYKVKSDEAKTGHNILIASEPDNGLYDAMNKGLHKASGDYVCYLNAGDVLPSADTLDLIAGSVGDGEILPGVLYGDTNVVDSEGRFLYHRQHSVPERLTWKSFRQGMLVCHQAFYARTDLAKNTPYDLHYRLSADIDWCIRVMKEAEACHLPLRNVHAVVVNYLEGGMSVKNHRASLIERFHLMTRHYGLFGTLTMHLWFVIRTALK